jgi:hypothetical protein
MKNLMYCLLFVLPFFLHSQEIRYNVIIGPSISSISANNNKITGTSSKIAFKAHVQGEYWFNDRYAITAGIGFSLSQGGTMEYLKGGDIWKEVVFSDTFSVYHNLPPNTALTYRINTLEFPFGFKLRTKEFGKFRFYVHAPEFSINLLTKARGDVDAGAKSTVDEDIRPIIHFFSLWYGIGIGAEYRISNDITLTGGLRYFESFTDLTVDSGRYADGTKEESKGIISSLDIRMGIIF